MKTVFVLFDSLNRLALGAYGGTEIATPNFDRFAKRSVTFDKHYVGSLPCMPARRDLHTGRLNFMHRHWGPLEPFDNSFATLLSQSSVYTHLITDHLHYFENGGIGYANAFDSWDFVRGQEYDALKPVVRPSLDRYKDTYDERHYPIHRLNDEGSVTRGNSETMPWRKSRAAINGDFLKEESDYPTAKCFASALDFLERNGKVDDWYLQLECFDPHEPFTAPERFKEAHRTGYNGKILNWPMYEKCTNSAEEIAEIRGNYAALVAMCDEYFGKLLDYFDEHDLWQDTSLVLSTDHGFLLSEHDWWAKNRMPYYEEISHIPMMIWHPDHADQAGTRRSSLTQTMDLMPTFLEMHGVAIPEEVVGASLMPLMARDEPIHDSVVFGMFAGPVGVTDGRFSYYLYPEDLSCENLNLYTLMPSHMISLFNIGELKSSELVPPFDFTKGAPVLKIRMDPKNTQVGQDGQTLEECVSMLFDLDADPKQEMPLDQPATVERLTKQISHHFVMHDAPEELYAHFGIEQSGSQVVRDSLGSGA